MTEETKAQLRLPVTIFREEIKCCYNCPHWNTQKEKPISKNGTCAVLDRYNIMISSPWNGICNYYSGDQNLMNNEVYSTDFIDDLIKRQMMKIGIVPEIH